MIISLKIGDENTYVVLDEEGWISWQNINILFEEFLTSYINVLKFLFWFLLNFVRVRKKETDYVLKSRRSTKCSRQ